MRLVLGCDYCIGTSCTKFHLGGWRVFASLPPISCNLLANMHTTIILYVPAPLFKFKFPPLDKFSEWEPDVIILYEHISVHCTFVCTMWESLHTCICVLSHAVTGGVGFPKWHVHVHVYMYVYWAASLGWQWALHQLLVHVHVFNGEYMYFSIVLMYTCTCTLVLLY